MPRSSQIHTRRAAEVACGSFLKQLTCDQASLFFFRDGEKRGRLIAGYLRGYLQVISVAGVRRGGKGQRRTRETREDRTWEDRVPSPSRAHFDLPPFLRPATQAIPTSLNAQKEPYFFPFMHFPHAFFF